MTTKHNEKNNTWEVSFYYKDLSGKSIHKHKRGFATKKEAIAWAEEFKTKKAKNLNMKFGSFYEVYISDMKQRLRENTIRTKAYVAEIHILPYFKDRRLSDISVADIREWQSILIEKGYRPTYLRKVNAELSAVFSYAQKYYDLPRNPCAIAGSIGKNHADEMNIWSLEEFEEFIDAIKDKPLSYYSFLTLFWTGIRIGELMALTLNDIDLNNKTININKSYQRIEKRDVITEPKTEKGKRVIALPDFLVEELKEYIDKLYGIDYDGRLFSITKSYLEHEIERGIKISGVKKIRLHDIRHSHASLLISKLGAQPLLVAQRLGHEKIQTTLDTYSHLYPNQNRDLADKLNGLVSDNTEESED